MLVRDVGNYEVRYIGIAHSGDVGFGRFFVFIGMRVVDSQKFQPVLANLPRQVDDFFGGHFIARRWVGRYILRWVGVGDLISAAGEQAATFEARLAAGGADPFARSWGKHFECGRGRATVY